MTEEVKKLFLRMQMEYADVIDLYDIKIGYIEYIDESLLRQFGDKMKWSQVFKHLICSQDFIKEVILKYGYKMHGDDLYNIIGFQNVDFKFVEEFKQVFGWWFVSMYKSLPEEFIEKYKENVNWSNISQFSKLSNQFMRKYEDKIDWERALRYQDVDCVLRDKHKLDRRNSCCESVV